MNQNSNFHDETETGVDLETQRKARNRFYFNLRIAKPAYYDRDKKSISCKLL